MNKNLKQLSEVIAEANDLFYEKNKTYDTVIGIIDKALRQQGMNSDAITVDCIPLNKKIVFLLHDEQPLLVDIALGNKAGEITSSTQKPLNELTVNDIVTYLQEYFSS